MNFPTLVYKSPGQLRKPGAKKTYRYRGAADQEQFDALLAEGWHASYMDAVGEGKRATEDENAPPTRAELEAKATELGLKFDGRTSDDKLLERINEALQP